MRAYSNIIYKIINHFNTVHLKSEYLAVLYRRKNTAITGDFHAIVKNV